MKKVFVFIVTAILLALASPLCRAQTFHVSGNVISKELKQPLWEAEVRVKGTTDNWTQTDQEGNYQLVVRNWTQNRKLVASYPHCYNNTEKVARKVNFVMRAVNVGKLIYHITSLGIKIGSFFAQEGYGPDGPDLV